MGCGCAKKGVRNTLSPRQSRTRLRAAAQRAGVVSQQNQQLQAQQNTATQNNQIQAQSLTPTPVRSVSGLSQERRVVEKRRRDAIRKKLGKP
jgi:cell division protein FtsL